MKPPNIMIYDGGEAPVTSQSWTYYSEKFSQVLNTDRYIFYPLTEQQIVNNLPWEDNSILLVLPSVSLSPKVKDAFKRYLSKGGSILSFSSDLIPPGVTINHQNFSCMLKYRQETIEISLNSSLTVDPLQENLVSLGTAENSEGTNFPVILQSESQMILCLVDLVSKEPVHSELKRCCILQDLLTSHFSLEGRKPVIETPQMKPFYLVTRDEKTQKRLNLFLLQKNNELHLKNTVLHIQSDAKKHECSEICKVHLLSNDGKKSIDFFNLNEFFCLLKTRILGTCLILSETVDSTMNYVEGLTEDLGLTCVALSQINGKGRAGNRWLSPKGCAMFSCHLTVPHQSNLGQSIPFVQHVAALSVVHAIRSIPAYKELNLRLKWPNDIYYGQEVKIGGVLVNCTTHSGQLHCYLGCGINLSNAAPTVCLQKLVEEIGGVDLLTLEWLIASVMNQLEALIDQVQIKGTASILPLYYKYWIHQDQHLTLAQTGQAVVVKGLDEYGFLFVSNKNGTQKFSLQPDGNSLDMMRNLISMKL